MKRKPILTQTANRPGEFSWANVAALAASALTAVAAAPAVPPHWSLAATVGASILAGAVTQLH